MARSLRKRLPLGLHGAWSFAAPPPALVAISMPSLVGSLTLVPSLTLVLVSLAFIAPGIGSVGGHAGEGRSGSGALGIVRGKKLLATFGMLAPPASTLSLLAIFGSRARGFPAIGSWLSFLGAHVGKGQTRAILRRPFGPRFIGPMMGPGAIISHGDATIPPETGHGQPLVKQGPRLSSPPSFSIL